MLISLPNIILKANLGNLYHLSSYTFVYISFFTIYLIFLFITIVIIIYDYNNPTKALFYLLIVLIAPIIGLILYYSFGINLRRQKFYERKVDADKQLISQIDDLYAKQKGLFETEYGTKLRYFKSLAYFLLHDSHELIGQNNYKILINGEEKFPVLFDAIKDAKSFIHIEYYIWKMIKLVMS